MKRTSAIGICLLVVVTSLAPGLAYAGDQKPRTVVSAYASAARLGEGGTLRVYGVVSSRVAGLTYHLMRSTDHGWVRVVTGRTAKRGKFAAEVVPPVGESTYQVAVLRSQYGRAGRSTTMVVTVEPSYMGEDAGQPQEPEEPTSEPVPDFSPDALRAYQDAIMKQINDDRARVGMAPLALSTDGDAYAQERARSTYNGAPLGLAETRKFPGGQSNYVRYCEGYDYTPSAADRHQRSEYTADNWDEVAVGFYYDSQVSDEKPATWGIYLIDRAS